MIIRLGTATAPDLRSALQGSFDKRSAPYYQEGPRPMTDGTPASTETIQDTAQAKLDRMQQAMLTLEPHAQRDLMPLLEMAHKQAEQEASQKNKTYSLAQGEKILGADFKELASNAPRPDKTILPPGGTLLREGMDPYVAPNPAQEKGVAVGNAMVNPLSGEVIYQGEKEQDPITRSETIMQGGKQVVVGVTQSGKIKQIGEAPPSSDKSTSLSPAAQKELFEADDIITASQNAVSALKQALTLNERAFSGPLAKHRAATLSAIPGVKNEAADATVSLDNLVTGQALEQLRAIFSGMPTEGERKVLLEVQGSVNLQPQQRREIWERAIQLSDRREKVNRQKAEQLRGGTYMKPGGGTANVPAINYGAAGVAPFNDAEKEQRYQEFKAGHQ